jgi:hypothetical protein
MPLVDGDGVFRDLSQQLCSECLHVLLAQDRKERTARSHRDSARETRPGFRSPMSSGNKRFFAGRTCKVLGKLV